MLQVTASPSDPAGTQSVLRALDVLECLAQSHSALSLTAIAERTGLTMPTAHRLLKALTGRQFLIVNPSTKEYSLGPALTRLASLVMQGDNLLSVAVPILSGLRGQVGETVSLHRPFGNERICVAEFVSHHPVRMESGVGSTYPLAAGASGKVLLAWLPPAEVRRILARPLVRMTDSTITSKSVLAAELATIREQGFATSVGETVPGASALAFPVFSPGQAIVAAVNVTGPATRWTRREMQKKAPLVREAVATIMERTAAGAP